MPPVIPLARLWHEQLRVIVLRHHVLEATKASDLRGELEMLQYVESSLQNKFQV